MLRSRWLALAGALFLLAPVARAQDCSGHSSCGGCPAQRKFDLDAQLHMPLSIDFRGVPLRDFLAHLHNLTGLDIQVDHDALQKAGIDLDQPVSVRVESTTLETILNLLNRATHAFYLVDADGVHITTAAALDLPACDGGDSTGVIPTACEEPAPCPKAVCGKCGGKCCCPEGTKCEGGCTPDNCTCTKGDAKQAAPCCEMPCCSKCSPCEGGKCGDECSEPAQCPCKSCCTSCCPVCACLHKVCACMLKACFSKTEKADVPCKSSTCPCEPACGMTSPCYPMPPCVCAPPMPPQCVAAPCMPCPPMAMPMSPPPVGVPCAYAAPAPAAPAANWTMTKGDKGICIHGPEVEGCCERVSMSNPEGCVVLEGHVSLKWDRNGQQSEVKGERVCVRLCDMAIWVGGAPAQPCVSDLIRAWYGVQMGQ